MRISTIVKIIYNQLKIYNYIMGNLVQNLSEGENFLDQMFLNCPFSKLREYYSSYKSICDEYTINSTEFAQIFGSDMNSYKLWDSNNSGRIDSMEMFSGIIVFSNSRYQDKIKFLFEMFDLNEQESLTIEAIQFMLINCCNASLKIYKIHQQINAQQIQKFVNNYFSQESQISYEDLLAWTSKVAEIRQFFTFIKKQIPQQQKLVVFKQIKQSYFKTSRMQNFKKPFVHRKNKYKLSDLEVNRKINNYVQQSRNQMEGPKQLNPKINWVFGIRVQDIRKPIQCISKGTKAINQKYIYFISNIAVIYFNKLNVQNHYTKHQHEISCLSVSQSGDLAATGQLGVSPSIFVWSINKLTTQVIIKGIHKNDISHIKFFNNDRYLISASRRLNPPVTVNCLSTGNTIFSIFIQSSIIELLNLNLLLVTQASTLSYNSIEHDTEGEKTFLVLCERDLHYVQLKSTQLVKKYFNLQQYSTNKITCGIVVSSSVRQYFMVLGSQNGEVTKWNDFQQFNFVIKTDSTLVSLVQIDKLCYALSKSKIFQINMDDFTILKQIIVPVEMYNLELIQLIRFNSNTLVAVSLMADVIEISDLLQQEEAFVKVHRIFKLENLTHSQIINSNQLYVSTQHLLYKIDVKQKQIRNIYNFESPINCVSALGDRLFIGSKNQVVISIYNERTQFYTANSNVVDLYIFRTFLIVLLQKRVLIFSKSNQKFFSKNPQQISTEYSLLKISPTNDEKIFFISTKEKKFLKLKMPHQLSEINQRLPIDTLQTKGHLQNSILISAIKNYFLITYQNRILFWNNIYQFIHCQDSYAELCQHSSVINSLHFYNSVKLQGFLSVGSKDQLIILWQNAQNTLERRSENEGNKNQQQIARHNQQSIQNVLINQIQSGPQVLSRSEILKDSQISIKSTTQNSCDKIIYSILFPQNHKIFDPLVNKSKIYNNPYAPPCASLAIDHIFGFQSASTRKSIYYSHEYTPITKPSFIKTSLRNQNKPLIQVQSYKKAELMISEKEILPYTQSHTNCQRYFIYFTDRICIRYCPILKEQRFYQEHNNIITCLNIHPKKKVCASCEAPFKVLETEQYVKGSIHLWETNSLKKIKKFLLKSKGQPKKIEFSRNGKYIAVLIVHKQSERLTFIQIYDWENQIMIAFRCLGIELYLDMQFNPYKERQLSIVGYNLIKTYQISNATLLLKESGKFERIQIITCLAYISNSYGNVIESDILTGNTEGDIGLFICGKYMVVKQKAHDKLINCIKVGELFKYKTILMTSGEDQILKIWDTKFNIINAIQIRNLSCFISKGVSQTSNIANFSVQSIDIYHCDANLLQKNQKKQTTILLLGTRNSDILQISINNEYKGLEVYSKSNKKSNESDSQDSEDSQHIEQEKPEKILFDYFLHFRNYCSIGRIFFTICDNIMLTFTNINLLEIWNVQKLEVIQFLKVGFVPTYAEFSNNGQSLVIGYRTGQVEFYQVIQNSFIKLLHRISNPEYCVLSVKFSERDSKIAISYYPTKTLKEFGKSTVHIYSNKCHSKKVIGSNKRQVKFPKISEIPNKSNDQKNGVYFMNFSSDDKEEFLLIYYQHFKNNERSNREEGTFLLWNNQRNSIQKSFDNIEFKQLNFCNIVNLRYNFFNFKEDQDVKQLKYKLVGTQMNQYDNIVILGDLYGQIILTKSSSLYVQSEENESKSYLAKYYKAHTSDVSILKVLDDHIYTAGARSNNIIRWKITLEKEEWDYDNLNKSKEDLFSQYLPQQRIKNLYHNIFFKRKNIYDLMNNRSKEEPRLKLQLKNILGRNALWTRNNLFYDYDDTIISHAGCNLILMSKIKDTIRQQFIKIDDSPFSSYPQISAITLSYDRKVIVAGTCSDPAKLMVWDIQSRTTLKSIVLNSIVEIRMIKMSHNNSTVICLGLSTKNRLMLVFVDFQQNQIKACFNFQHSLNTKIHDFIFLPNESKRFITCGLHHMAEWKLNCGVLNYSSYKITNVKDMTQFYRQERSRIQQEILNIYCIIFVKDLIITGAADGYIYIWKDKQIAHKQNAHPNYSILSLYSSVGSKILATGGSDSKVILWQIGMNNLMQKIYEYVIFQEISDIPVNYHIQSICIGKTKVIVGTRSGQIYEFNRPDQIEKQSKQQSRKNQNKLLLPSFNHDEVNSICMSPSSKKIYILTKKGNLSIYWLHNLKKILERQFNDKEIVKMIVSQLSDNIFMVYKDEIRVFTQLKDDLIRGVGDMSKKNIINAILSPDQKYLALLLAQNQSENAKLLIYYFDNQPKPFCNFQIIQNIPAEIEYIDFSTDNCYIVYKSKDETENIIELSTHQKINYSVQFDIEWAAEGKKSIDSIKTISAFENEDNKILKILQIKDHSIIASDQIGAVRLFNYPVNLQDGYSQCSIEHMNNITICLVSRDSKTLVTYSEIDKNINIWDILLN